MAVLTLTKQNITNFTKKNFVAVRQTLLNRLEKHMNIENIDIEMNGEDSIAFVMLGEGFSVEFNVSMDDLYELISMNDQAPYIINDDIQCGNYKGLFQGLAGFTLFLVNRKEEMTDDAPLYEQAAYSEIDDFDRKFDSLIADVVNPFRQAVTAVVD